MAGEVVVVELLVLEGGSVEGVDAVVGAVDDRVGRVGGSGVETGHCGARKEASCSWQLACGSSFSLFLQSCCFLSFDFCSACTTKFCHWDFVLKYVVMGKKRTFR